MAFGGHSDAGVRDMLRNAAWYATADAEAKRLGRHASDYDSVVVLPQQSSNDALAVPLHIGMRSGQPVTAWFQDESGGW